MGDYVKLAKAPVLILQHPACSACDVELDIDEGFWLCPCCGTAWDMGATDGDEGELYESWSGDSLDGPSTTWGRDDVDILSEVLDADGCRHYRLDGGE